MAKSSTFRRGGRVRQSARTGAFEFIMRPQRTWIGTVVGRIIRARVELCLALCVGLIYWWLSAKLPTWGLWTILIGIVLLVLVVKPARRYVTRRYWCVFSRHRARACFRSTWTMTYDGTLPYLIWSRPTSVGERIRVWLPAGLSVNDIERVADKLAVSCWARECRIEPSRKRAASLVVHIVRRDPLESAQLAPDVLDHVHPAQPDDANTVPLPRREDVEVSTPQPSRASSNGTPRSERAKKPNSNGAVPPPVVEGFGGMDVSDYVDLD
ncbi:hypothetical protein [Qaidamihabitans albus]|uniref:hypothetical protein n=1 Tax=Qaidamihabitans albus TaxID=2795733 RepID=UPI0018F1E7BE|nr:hypothetical protein [Qaidamihabitans albus]